MTHPRIYSPPSTTDESAKQIDAWLESPTLALLTESSSYWDVLRQTLINSRVAGPQVHDARIAALCREHGVRELWSADRDFNRFAGLTVVNPLVR